MTTTNTDPVDHFRDAFHDVIEREHGAQRWALPFGIVLVLAVIGFAIALWRLYLL